MQLVDTTVIRTGFIQKIYRKKDSNGAVLKTKTAGGRYRRQIPGYYIDLKTGKGEVVNCRTVFAKTERAMSLLYKDELPEELENVEIKYIKLKGFCDKTYPIGVLDVKNPENGKSGQLEGKKSGGRRRRRNSRRSKKSNKSSKSGTVNSGTVNSGTVNSGTLKSETVKSADSSFFGSSGCEWSNFNTPPSNLVNYWNTYKIDEFTFAEESSDSSDSEKSRQNDRIADLMIQNRLVSDRMKEISQLRNKMKIIKPTESHDKLKSQIHEIKPKENKSSKENNKLSHSKLAQEKVQIEDFKQKAFDFVLAMKLTYENSEESNKYLNVIEQRLLECLELVK